MAGYTYDIKLRDLMSKGFNKAASNASKFYNNLKSKSSQANKSIKHNTASINDMNIELANLQRKQANSWNTKEISKYGRAIRKTEHRLRKLKNLPPMTMVERFRKVRSQLGGIIGLTGGLAIGLAAFGAVKGVIKLGADLEQTRISFQTMLGSAEAGNNMIADLNKFANVTPFSNSDLQDSAKMLLNFGVASKKILPTLQTLRDISGGNKEKLRGLTLAFAQVSSAGRLQGQDLNQMINQGFNPLLEISRMTGVEQDVLRDKMRKGAISSQMVANAFTTATQKGGTYHEMMKKQSETMAGKWSTMVGTFSSKMAELGESTSSTMKPLLDFGIFLVNNLAIIGPSVVALGSVVAVVKLWTIAQKFLNIALINNPIGKVIMLIMALIGPIISVVKKTEGWGKSFSAVGTIIKTAAVMIWEDLKHSFTNIGYNIQWLWLKFKSFGQYIKQLFINIGKAINLAIHLDFAGAKKALTQSITTGASKEIEELEKKKTAGNDAYAKKQIANLYKIAKAKAQIGIKWKSKEAIAQQKKAEELKKITKNDFVFGDTKNNTNHNSSTADSIVTGGKRSLIQNITFERVIENVNQTVNEGASEMDDLVSMVIDGITRRMGGTFKSLTS